MHEFSICQNLVDSILIELKQVKQTPKKVISVKVVIGRLRQIIPDYIQFSYEVLCQENDLLRGSKLIIEDSPIQLKCQNCNHEQIIDAPQFACSNCGSTDLETLKGMELYLDSIEVEKQL